MFSSAEAMDFLTFHLGDREFAVDLHRVVEVVSPLPITAVPGMPPVLRGLIGLRGEPTPVLDAGLRLGGHRVEVSPRSPMVILTATRDDRELRFGLLVEGAGRKVDVESLLPWSASQANVLGDDACVGFADVDGALVLVLDVDRLLELRGAVPPAEGPARSRASPTTSTRAGPPTSPMPVQPAAESPVAPRRGSIQPIAPSASPRAPASPTQGSPPRAAPTTQHRPQPPARALPSGARRSPPQPYPSPSSPPAPASQPHAVAHVDNPAAPFVPRRPHPDEAATSVAAPPPEWCAPTPAPAVRLTDAQTRGMPLIAWIAAAAGILLAIAFLALTRGGAGAGGAADSQPRGQPARQPMPPSPTALASPLPPLPQAAQEPAARAALEGAPGATALEAAPAIPPPSPPSPSPPPAPTLPTPEPGPVRAPEAARPRRPLPSAMVVTVDTPACEIHEVRKGDTLWWISARKLGDPYRWPELFGENRELLKDPDVIEIHDRIRIPGACNPTAR